MTEPNWAATGWGAGSRPVRRHTPAKPCRWCVRGSEKPATHVVKWPAIPQWTEDGPWLPPPRVLVCAFHLRFALRYPGSRGYRFRRLG